MPYTTNITVDDILEAIPGSRGIVKNVADKLNCSSSLIRRAISDNPVLVLAIQNEKEDTFDSIEEKMMKEAQNGKAWAIKYYLDNLGQSRGYGVPNLKDGPKGFTIKVVYETPAPLPSPSTVEDEDGGGTILTLEGDVVETAGSNGKHKSEEAAPETSGISEESIEA